MSFEQLVTGAVIVYPYLWKDEELRGETEGRKTRPCVISLRKKRPNKPDALFLIPITTKRPLPHDVALEIPETDKRLAKLAADIPLWVIVSSMNYEELPGSYYLEPDPPIGQISRRFLQLILEEIQRIYPKIAVTSRR
ncbi:MAG: hypothetical protein ACR65Z_07090 [Methylocystis sp.]